MTADDVIDTWYAAGEERWFTKDPAFDGMLSVRFKSALAEARNGAFDHWAKTPKGALGLVILLDQFSRNIHRGSPLAFAADARALRLAKDVVAKGFDHAFPAPRRDLVLSSLRACRGSRLPDALRRPVHDARSVRNDVLVAASSRHHRQVRPLPASQSCLGRKSTPKNSPSSPPAALRGNRIPSCQRKLASPDACR